MVESSYLLAGVRPWSKRAERSWCGRRDSNPHIFRYQDLNLARLPVPPRPPGRRSRGDIAGVARGARAVAYVGAPMRICSSHDDRVQTRREVRPVGEIEAKAEWADAEKWAWGRIAEGEVADFSAAYGELEPRSRDGWTAQRSLRPAFLSTIPFDRAWHDHIPVSGIRIVGARWTGPLILTQGTVNRPLVLDRCRFEGGVDLTGCRFAWRLSFQRSAFCAADGGPSLIFDQVSAARGDLCRSYFGNGARGEDSVFATTLDFTGAEFEGPLDLKGAHVGSLHLMEASATDLDFRDFEADGNVNLRGARVAGTMDMSSGIVGQEFELGA